jgi:hypothetical protein
VDTVLLVAPWAPPSLAFARSLRRLGIGTYLLQATPDPPFPRWTMSSLRGSQDLPAHFLGTSEGIAVIRRCVADVGASALVAMTDPELVWLSAHRGEFEPGCRVLVQSSASLLAIQSKCHQLELARTVGFDVLPTVLLRRPEDADLIPASCFPVAVRPDRPGDVEPGFKIRLAASKEEARDLVGACQRLDSPLIAQPFRSLPNLLFHGARAVTGEVLASRCYDVARKFEGVGLSLEPRPLPDRLESLCRRFVELAGITGCYHFEFLYSSAEERTYFLEANVRLGGTTDKVVNAGFDEPALLLESYGLCPHPVPPVRSRPGRVVTKRFVLKHLVWAATGRLTAFDYPNVSRLKHVAYSCRDLLLARESTFDRRDIPGSLRFQLRGLTGRA